MAQHAESNHCWRYNIATDDYTQMPNMPTSMRGGSGGALPDGRIIICGNYPSDSLFIFDPVEDKWTDKPLGPGVSIGWETAALGQCHQQHQHQGMDGQR